MAPVWRALMNIQLRVVDKQYAEDMTMESGSVPRSWAVAMVMNKLM